MTRIGTSYVRGRVATDLTETGTSRVAGQFAQMESCAIGSGDRVQVPAPADETTFGIVIYLDPDNAYGGAGQPTAGYVLDWRLSANERITVYYDKGAERWTLEVRHSATTQTVTLADTFAAGDAIALYIGGDASYLDLAVDGGTIGTGTARTQIPAGLPSTMDIGSTAGASQFLCGVGAVAVFSGRLSQTQWEALAGLRAVRPPVYGEGGTDDAMSVLWYGAHAVAWTLPASGACIDLNHLEGRERFMTGPLAGAASGPSLHRMVESPLRDGAAYVDTRGRRRQLDASVMLVSRTDVPHLWDLRRELIAALTPRLGEGLLMYAPGEVVYEIPAILAAEGVADEPMGSFALGLRIPFSCSAGDWSESVRAAAQGTVPFEGWAFPWSFPWTFTESAVDIATTNAGDAPVYPQVVITAGVAGCTAPSVENETSGKTFGMRSTFEMTAGEELVIDMSARTVLLEGVSVMNQRDPDSEMWALDVGANTIVARCASGSAVVEVRHAPLYVGV